jgi:hypothetical protein
MSRGRSAGEGWRVSVERCKDIDVPRPCQRLFRAARAVESKKVFDGHIPEGRVRELLG